MNKKRSTSQNKITLGLYKLLLKKDISQITVTDICKDAGVSRMSFYRNYNSIDDIFIKFTDECFEELYYEFLKIETPTGYDLIHLVFEKMYKYRRQIKALTLAKKEDLLLNQFESYASYLAKKLDHDEIKILDPNPVTVPFLSGGFYGVMLSWVKNGFKYTPDEMTEFIIKLNY